MLDKVQVPPQIWACISQEYAGGLSDMNFKDIEKLIEKVYVRQMVQHHRKYMNRYVRIQDI